MSFDVNGLVAAAILLLLVGTFFAFATMPRWWIKSVSRHRLWRLRDRVVDDVISKKLPANHGAVQDLIKVTQWRIDNHRSLDLLHALAWSGAHGKVPDSVQKELREQVALNGLTKDQQERISAYREECIDVTIAAMMLGSWIGIASVLPALTVAIVSELRKERRATTNVAQEAVAASRPGRFFRERITHDECAPLHAPA